MIHKHINNSEKNILLDNTYSDYESGIDLFIDLLTANLEPHLKQRDLLAQILEEDTVTQQKTNDFLQKNELTAQEEAEIEEAFAEYLKADKLPPQKKQLI